MVDQVVCASARSAANPVGLLAIWADGEESRANMAKRPGSAGRRERVSHLGTAVKQSHKGRGVDEPGDAHWSRSQRLPRQSATGWGPALSKVRR